MYNKAKKLNKRHTESKKQNRKENKKTSLVNDMIIYTGIPKESTKNLLKLGALDGSVG